MKSLRTVAAAVLPLLIAGCLTADDVMNVANTYANAGRPQGLVPAGYRPSPQVSYQGAYVDGYRKGYNAGYYDGGRGMPYRARSSYGGAAYNAPFSDGYYKGYAEGFHESRRGMGFGCAL